MCCQSALILGRVNALNTLKMRKYLLQFNQRVWSLFVQIDALSEVVEAVRGYPVEVYMDGGVRRGTDVFKALAMGARAVFIGRPALWGLACNVSQCSTCVSQSQSQSLKTIIYLIALW